MSDVYLDGKDKTQQYKLGSPIGSGGFGTVYNATDTVSNEEVAIKIFQSSFNVTDTEAIESWKREAEQALNIKDEHVITSYEFREGKLPDGSQKYYLVMEFADGGSLDQFIEDQKTKSEFISEDQLKNDYKEILKGMDAIHKVALHRDLKPENMLFVNGVLKISDFGLAKYVDQSTRTRSFKGWGTVRYMAPESWTFGKMSKATDIYSLGIVFYQLATLELPYSSADDKEMENLHKFGDIPSAKKVNSNLSHKLEGIIRKMMQKSASDRYQDVSEITAELEQGEPESKAEVLEAVTLAKQILEKEQQAKNENLKREEDAQNRRNIAMYKFKELIEKVQILVDSINSDMPEEKMFLSMGSETSYTLIWKSKDLLRFEFNPELFYSELVIRGLHIMALCTVELSHARQDEGMNFILVQNAEDEYGTWKVLEINTSALVPRVQYPRIANFGILQRISKLGNAMDVITNQTRDDVDEELKKLINLALDYINNPRRPEEMISDPIHFPPMEERSEEDDW